MKHTPMPAQSGPKSAFTELLESKNRPISEFHPKPRLAFLPEAHAFLVFPKLIPNCLLTRHPILVAYSTELAYPERQAVRWLSMQLKRHGYQAESLQFKDADALIPESLEWSSPCHVFAFSKDETRLSHIRTGTKIHSLTQFKKTQIKLLTKPLSNLSKLLERANSLAETDHQ